MIPSLALASTRSMRLKLNLSTWMCSLSQMPNSGKSLNIVNKPIGLFHPYQMGESTSNFRGIKGNISFFDEIHAS